MGDSTPNIAALCLNGNCLFTCRYLPVKCKPLGVRDSAIFKGCIPTIENGILTTKNLISVGRSNTWINTYNKKDILNQKSFEMYTDNIFMFVPFKSSIPLQNCVLGKTKKMYSYMFQDLYKGHWLNL